MSRRNKNRPAGGTQPNTLTLDAFSNPLFRLGYGSQSPLEATSYPLTRMTMRCSTASTVKTGSCRMLLA